MIKKEKLSGADCMQSTPFSFRYEPIFLQKMGYKRNRQISLRIKRPPSQCLCIEMAACSSIMI